MQKETALDTAPTLQDGLSELLAAQGFATMAREVRDETDHARLCKYARIIVRNAPELFKRALVLRFKMLRLM